MRKPDFCICQNKGADLLCSNCTADLHLCFSICKKFSFLMTGLMYIHKILRQQPQLQLNCLVRSFRYFIGHTLQSTPCISGNSECMILNKIAFPTAPKKHVRLPKSTIMLAIKNFQFTFDNRHFGNPKRLFWQSRTLFVYQIGCSRLPLIWCDY